MFNNKYRYYFIALLAIGTFLSTEFCEVYKYFKIEIEWYHALGTIAIVSLIIWEISRLLENVFIKKPKDQTKKIRHLIFYFFCCSAITILITTLIVLVESMLIHNYKFADAVIPLKLNIIYASLINLLFHLLNAIFYYFKEYRAKALEAEQLKIATTQAELQLVKSQINPHFLFNNLNVLSALIMQNSSEANNFIEAFSQVYRYILNNHEKEVVTIKAELEFIKPYIFLLEKRFEHGLKINIEINEKVSANYIIPASMQMLIENAIKHNIASRSKPLTISLKTNGNNMLEITNNLQLKEVVTDSTEIGLQNIVKRYKLAAGQDVIIEKTATMFKVSLPLLTINDL